MDVFDLEFIEWSLVCDDPKLLEKIQNRYYDPEFDEWEQEFEQEQQHLERQKQRQKATEPPPPPVEMPDAETVSWSAQKPPTKQQLPTEEYEVGDTSQFKDEDWVREE